MIPRRSRPRCDRWTCPPARCATLRSSARSAAAVPWPCTNSTRDEGAALSGDYRPLLGVFQRLTVGTLLLETSTPRAGDLAVLKDLPATVRLGVGVVNQKQERVEPVAEIVAHARRAIDLVG